LAQKGAKIAVNDLDKDKAEDVVREIRGFQGDAESFPGNVLDEEFPPRLVNSVLQRWGKINCLINNAGMLILSRSKGRTGY
jgi:3-oxoacyl-[acyl-carrier protein] reductase